MTWYKGIARFYDLQGVQVPKSSKIYLIQEFARLKFSAPNCWGFLPCMSEIQKKITLSIPTSHKWWCKSMKRECLQEHTITSDSAREVALQLRAAMKSDLAMGHLHLLKMSTLILHDHLQNMKCHSVGFGCLTATQPKWKRHISLLRPSLRGDNSTNDAIHSSQLESATCATARHSMVLMEEIRSSSSW